MAGHGESDTGALFRRFLLGLVFSALAAVEASGGPDQLPVAGFFAGAALYLLRPSSERARQAVNFGVDFTAVAIFAALCDRSGVLWRAPETMEQLFRLSPVGAGVAAAFYIAGVVSLTARSRLPLRIALFLLPFLFCLLVALGSPPVTQIGSTLLLGLDVPEPVKKIAGRTFVLFLLNEAVVVGVPLALGRFLPREWRPHGILALSAFLASLTPFIASGVSVYVTPYAPAPIASVLAAIAAALAQAGLWGQTYLVTQALAGMLRAAPSLSVVVFHNWKTGAEKGAVYGFVYMGLLLAIGLVVSVPSAVTLIALLGPLAGALLGAGLYPLARTIIESTDSTPPFIGRIEEAYLRPVNFARGAVAGAAVSVALMINLPAMSGSERFLFGVITGALAYAGVDLAHDCLELMRERRQRFRSWRVYTLAALLGGVVAGAIAWYLDADQVATVTRKFFAYVTLDYAAEGRGPVSYSLRPLFSKWGLTELGVVDGGVRLFYDESLSGVIQWVFAAPLFSINFFFLTALITRSLHPLRQLATWEGLDMLIVNAVHVLRWGLWMAPVIYSFLKAAPDPAWYNQDGLIRTTVATWMSYILPDNEFRAWSLDIFTALLAFDALRVLIWFDHMGMRVATLVNLSFVGGDMLDEQAARFVGKEQVSRAIPSGIRHFGTWAPLLLPFYLPRGADWDKAWTAAEQMAASRPPSYIYLVGGYLAFAGLVALGLVLFLLGRLARAQKIPLEGVTGAGGAPGSRPLKLTNGLMTSEWFQDGQGAIRIEGVARGGPPIDLTRRPDDHAHPRGRFLFLREEGGELWSVGEAPTRCPGACGKLSDAGENCLFFMAEQNGFAVEVSVSLSPDEAVEIQRLKIVNLEPRARKLTLASLREWVLNETGAEMRDPAYNALHVGTWYVKALNAVFAQNRLLKGGARRQRDRRLSPEIGFHAIGAGPGAKMTVVGYEDVKSRFYGMGPTNAPDSLVGLGEAPRSPDDEGLLYGFEPCASLRLELDIGPAGSAELIIVDGWARNMGIATDAVARHLGVPPAAPEILNRALSTRRRLIMPRAPAKHRYAFSEDGRSLTLQPGAPRPFAHVISNALGTGCVLTNDGDIFSFSSNSRLNSFTPFRMGEGRMAPAGQMIYVYDLARTDAHSPTFVPLRRRDARYEVTFTPGAAIFRTERDHLEMEMTVFSSPTEPVEFRLLKIRNKTVHERLLQIVPAMEVILAETPLESLGRVQSEIDDDLHTIYFRNPANNFVKGWAFVTTSIPAEFAETSRRRFLGHESRNPYLPYMVEHGHPDAGAPAHERKVAAFSGAIDVPAGEEVVVVVALGQTTTMDDAKRLAALARDPAYAKRQCEASEEAWNEQLSVLRIKTNRPDVDRLVNDWLPYQLLAARLWGRTGPSQRSGATGYRDQLQDVIPLIHLAPERARAQILLHARHQYLEGDACKWWHRAPNGGTGLADRTHSSDPHLWLPYVAIRYVKGSGDWAILDAVETFLEAPPVPKGQEGEATVPLRSRDKDTLLGHCARAIDYTLDRFGAHGLPLVGSGDWDDGMQLVGVEGRGESVWLGFFLHGILLDIAPFFEKKGDKARAERYRERAGKLRAALAECWRGDRYVRDFADDGREISPMSAMVAHWPTLSGAVDAARGREAIEKALAALARSNRILLVTPPFNEHSDPYPGRNAEYPPGVRENGGQYSHGVSWFVDALAKLGVQAKADGDEKAAQELFARAVECWIAISPISKVRTPAEADIYGMPPHQQAADVYEGEGYEGRGGWGWYTGAAARMLSAAYAMLGLEFENGELRPRPDAFEPKGDLRLESATYMGKTFGKAVSAAKRR
ncbi:GH36-type glycosyl hydrolase domain-containing protein [Methylocystis sp. JAN1]|uniref:GH36-type glycosyl hydrolase domain-containing protein n=1 Tax=Methylocystis sp. JAN1 TaxID=3397211 RepID=UPI003FA2C998